MASQDSSSEPVGPGDSSIHGGAYQSAPGTNGSSVNGTGTNGVLATIDDHLAGVPALGWNYGPPARPEILKARPNPLELLHAVRRRWPLAMGLGVSVAMIGTFLLWYFLPVRYEAFALLKVAEKPPSVLGGKASGTEEFAIFKRTQVQLIRSNVVLQGTLREAEISQLATIQEYNDDPVSWLKDQLVIDYPDDAEIMRIAMKGKRPEDLKKIVNKIVAVYMREIVERDRDQRLEHENKLDKSHSQMSNELQQGLGALRSLEAINKTTGSESAKLKRNMAIDELNGMADHRTRLMAQIDDTKLQLMLSRTRQEHPEESRPPDVIIENEMEKDPVIARSANELILLGEAVSAARTRSANAQNSPSFKKLLQRVQVVEERIEERKNYLRPRYLEALATGGTPNAGIPTNHLMNLSLPLLEAQLKHQEDELKTADEAIAKQTEHVEGLENYSAQVAQKAEDLRALQLITTDLKRELDRVRIERLAPERIVKVDDAVLASGSGDAVRKYVAVAFTAILGFGLVVLSVAFLEFQSRKVNAVQEVNDGLGIRVVGELPMVTGRVWRRIKGGKGNSVLKALMAERIDGTRTALIHSSTVTTPRVVMVTSAEPHEGKTTTASQLAASLARSGRRTLYIDADVRNPGAHRVFEMPQDPGLCELLRGEAERDAVIHPTRTANLWLMPAGRCDLRSVQALSTSYLGTAIAALCLQFDFIVIDSGPVLKIADPLLIGQHVDAAIVSVLRDVSKVPKVYEASERLRSVGITVLGCVVNGVNDDAARHGVELLMAETPQPQKSEPTVA